MHPSIRPIAAAMLTASLALATPSMAHVQLDDPNGGEQLVVGSTHTITWQVAVEHNLENWDLWYSVGGEDGPWIPIAMDLPAGDPAVGSVHEHEWTVPDAVSGQVRVRVRQDNVGMDYIDDSDADLSIAPPAVIGDVDENGVVNVEDLLAVILGWGRCAIPPASCPADVTSDGLVGADDLIAVILDWTPG